MIESFAKIAETSAKANEVWRGAGEFKDKNFDPDKRIEIRSSDANSPQGEKNSFDPDKRVDVEKARLSVEEKGGFDPDKRVEPKSAEKSDNDNFNADKEWKNSAESGKVDTATEAADAEKKQEQRGLSDEERERIKKETGWSDEIIDSISSTKEYEIYSKAGLVEKEINGKKCLVRSDIDFNQKDEFGRTNKERMESGLSPLAQNGETVELHHIGQRLESPLAELTTTEHRGKGNDTVLHDKQKESEIDRGKFDKERQDYWRERGKTADA